MQTIIFEPGKYCGNIDTLLSGDDIIASITRYNTISFNRRMHYHENAHFSFVLSGGCAERKKNAYERLPGKLVYYHSGEEHQMLAVDNRSIYVNLEICAGFLERNDLDAGSIERAFKHPDLNILMAKLYGELLNPDRFSAASTQAALLDLLSLPAVASSTGLPAWVKNAQELLREEYQRSWSLIDLALALDMHPVTISRYFRRYFGCTLGEYRRKLQAEHALMLLSSGRSIAEVVFACDFYDQSHLIRIFKQQTGLRPFQLENSIR